jgi:hypothetical protein
MPALTYLDFDLLIEPASAADGSPRANDVPSAEAAPAAAAKDFRARVLASPAGEAECDFALPFSQQDLEIFVLRIIGLGTRRRARRIESPEMDTIKAFGAKLFASVFSEGVHDCLVRSLDEADRSDVGLRLRMRLASIPELANVPWEYLYDPGLASFFCLSDRTPLVRYIDLPRAIRPLTVTPPLRVLTMISSPRDYPELDTETEWLKLHKSLQELESRGRVLVERMDSATLPNLQHRLRSGQYHVFHFIGHGGFDERAQDGVLMLEDVAGNGDPVSGRDLGVLLHDHRSLRLAVLNACEGARTSPTDPFAGTAQSLIQQGIPAVIAMQFEFSDEAAITFSQEFYQALGESLPVDAALAEARKAISTQINAVEWATPVLYMRSPDGRIFDLEDRRPLAPTERPEAAPPILPAAAPPTRVQAGPAPKRPRFPLPTRNLRWVAAVLLVLGLGVGGFLFVKSNHTRVPAASNFSIAFVNGNESSHTIQLVNPDGTGWRDTVPLPGDSVDPTWSPDHKKLAFANKAPGQAEYHIYLMTAPDGEPQRLTKSSLSERFPAWSPGGRTIAFVTGPPGHLSLFWQNVDGTAPKYLDQSMADSHPTWSPDRIGIVFSMSGPQGGIYKVSGQMLTRLTSDPTDYSPAGWPGGKIVFQRSPGGICCQLFVIDSNGGTAEPLGAGVLGAEPSWSSDGKQIVYHVGSQIWVVGANGSNPHQIYAASGDNPDPAW